MLRRLIKIIIGISSVAFGVWLLDATFPDEGIKGGYCGIAPDYIKAAHKYHGITSSTLDGGDAYFIRKGKKCKLLTDDFLKEWGGRKGNE